MEFLQNTLITALVALILDMAIGWPDALFRRIGHPVTWLGRLVSALDRRLNHGGDRLAKGVIASLLTIAAATLPAVALTVLIRPLPYGAVILGVLAWPLVASRSFLEMCPDAQPRVRTPVRATTPPTASVSGVGRAKIK